MVTAKSITKYLLNYKNYFNLEKIYLFEQEITDKKQFDIKAKADQGSLIVFNNREELDNSNYDLSQFAFLRSILNKDQLWQGGVLFLYTVNGKPAHLSWVALKNFAAYSDPYFMSSNQKAAGYIGPCYTLEQFRGLGIYPHVLNQVCQYLRKHGKAKVQILTRQSHPASVRGIEKAGVPLIADVICLRILFRNFYWLKRRK